MSVRQGRRLVGLILLALGIFFKVFAGNNPCRGPNALLAVVDRPTIADSPCTVAPNNALLELGYQYQKLVYTGYAQNFPTAEFRFGLPADNELSILLPNYIHQSLVPHSGFNATSIGFKHEIEYTDQWILTLNGIVTPPSGSSAFGSKGAGGFLSGIFNYSFNKKISFTCQLALSSQTQSVFNGGQRFTSINTDAFFTWSLQDKLQVYGEIYGQSKTGPNQGSGFNVASGLIYLINQNLTVDVEGSQHVSGLLGGLTHYVGAGIVFQF